jgi:hypothetical protein
MPHTCRSRYPTGSAQLGGEPTFPPDFLRELTNCAANSGTAVRNMPRPQTNTYQTIQARNGAAVEAGSNRAPLPHR